MWILDTCSLPASNAQVTARIRTLSDVPNTRGLLLWRLVQRGGIRQSVPSEKEEAYG
jgi:hypothetical protein